MKKLVLSFMFFSSLSVFAQVGIGVSTANMDASAQLDISSTTKGLLAPRMTDSQKNAIANPATGLLIYQTDATTGFYYFDGSIWKNGLGPQGIQGVQGEQGPMGMMGMRGMDGMMGMPGMPGEQGPMGPQGEPGMMGMRGMDGMMGMPGMQGEQGPMGPMGPQGEPGMMGMRGMDGMPGQQGPMGPMGPMGNDGMMGMHGMQGIPGEQGPMGPMGPIGNDGMMGMHGMQGIPGEQGPMGPMGPQGVPGMDGNNASINIGAIDFLSNSNGASIDSGILRLSPADANNGGIVTNFNQSFGGNKTFSNNLNVNGDSYFNNAFFNGNMFNVNTLGASFNVDSQMGIQANTQRFDVNIQSFQSNVPFTSFRMDSQMGIQANAQRFDFNVDSFQSNGSLTSFGMDSQMGIHADANIFRFNGMLADFNSSLFVSGITTSNSFVKQGGSSTEYLMADGSVSTSAGGSLTVGPIENSPNFDGASINSGVLTLAPAHFNSPGIVTGSQQVFAGTKTFVDGLRVENKPFLPTKLDQWQIDNLSYNSNELEEGMVVYNTSTRKLQVYSFESSSIINDSFAATFTNEGSFNQTFISPATGIISAIQLFVKSDTENGIFADVMFEDISNNYLGSAWGQLFIPNLGTPGWINLQANQIFVNSGQTYKFQVNSPMFVKYGTNSNYASGSVNAINGGLANGDDLMFRIYITPINGTPYWVNLN